MKRREVIQQIATISGGLIALPAWAKSWDLRHLPVIERSLNVSDRIILDQIVDAILPETDIPGAKSLGVPAFVETMLADCYEKSVQENVENGLRQVDSLAQSNFEMPFTDLSISDKQTLLLSIEAGTDTDLKDFYSLIKSLTIQGYTTSEYVQTNYLEYEMAPGYYHGCVPVK